MNSRIVQFISTKPDIRPGAIIRPIIECIPESEIACGGFGRIHTAREINNNKEYAIKFLNREDLLERELLAIRVQHPHVVEIVGYSETDRAILMELIRGETLRSLLDNRKHLINSAIYLSIFSQIALGLNAVHDANIVHLDLNPKNILINQEKKVKIGDFGSAINSGKERSFLCFTHPYIAPEQINTRINNFPIDIFHFGLLMYESLIGHLPTEIDQIHEVNLSAFDTLYKQNNSFNLSELSARTDIPQFLTSIISRSLYFDPNSRITAKEISDEFTRNYTPLTQYVRILSTNYGDSRRKFNPNVQDVLIIEPADSEQVVNGTIKRKRMLDLFRDLLANLF